MSGHVISSSRLCGSEQLHSCLLQKRTEDQDPIRHVDGVRVPLEPATYSNATSGAYRLESIQC